MRAAICGIVIGLGLVPASGAADVAEEGPPTRLEALLARSGAVVIRGSSRVGAVRGEPGSLVAVASKEFTNASSGERAYGLTVEVRRADHREPDRLSYVDLDEIPALLGGLELMSKLEKSVTTLDQFEADYRTKGGLVVTVYNASGGMKAAVSTGVPGPAAAELEFGEFQRFRQLLQTAYEGLRALGGNDR